MTVSGTEVERLGARWVVHPRMGQICVVTNVIPQPSSNRSRHSRRDLFLSCSSVNRHLSVLHQNTETNTDNIIRMDSDVTSDVDEIEWHVGEG